MIAADKTMTGMRAAITLPRLLAGLFSLLGMLTPVAGYADGTSTQKRSSVQAENLLRCDDQILQIINSNVDRASVATDAIPKNIGTDSTSDCRHHPWIRMLLEWSQAGMPVTQAREWLTTETGEVINPLLTGDLADLARMQAAYTLAKSGDHLRARQLWVQLSISRPSWAEVWFNLAISYQMSGLLPLARQALSHADQSCHTGVCKISVESRESLAQQLGGRP